MVRARARDPDEGRIAERHGRRRKRYTVGDVSKATGIAPNTLKRWIRLGWLRASYGRGRVAYLRRGALPLAAVIYPDIAKAIVRAQARVSAKQPSE